jgi:transcriptional regulator with XRE-family HTH domain
VTFSLQICAFFVPFLYKFCSVGITATKQREHWQLRSMLSIGRLMRAIKNGGSFLRKNRRCLMAAKRLSSHPFHTNLAILIKESGMTQTQLADELNIARTTLSHWCTGQTSLPESMRSKITQRLHCDPDALFVISCNTQTPPQELERQYDFNDTIHIEQIREREECTDQEERMKPDRRHVLKASAAILTGTATIDLWERLQRAIHTTSVDQSLIASLQTSVQACWQFQPDIAGIVSRDYLDQVKHALEKTIFLLEGSLFPSHREQLTAIAAEFALIIGVMYQDFHEPSSAFQYFSVALEAAQECNNYSLQSVILGWMSMLPGDHALSTVQKALPLAEKYASATTTSWVAARMAEVYANQLPYEEAHEKASLLALEKASTVAPRGSTDDPYWTGFDPLLQAGYRGACYLKLHRATAAETELRTALHLEQNKTYHQAVLLIDLANALGQQQRIEDACEPFHQALVLLSQARSPILQQRAIQCRKVLNPWREETCVKVLDYHISTALAWMV